jgi:hypothetical protein
MNEQTVMDGLTVVYNAPDLTNHKVNGAVNNELLDITRQGIPVIVNLDGIGGANSTLYVAKLQQLADSLEEQGGLDKICLSTSRKDIKKVLNMTDITRKTLQLYGGVQRPVGLFNTYTNIEEAIEALERPLTHRIELTPSIFNIGESTARVILTHETTTEDIDQLLQLIWFFEPLDKYNIVVAIPEGAKYNHQTIDMLRTARKELQAKGMDYKTELVGGAVEFKFKPDETPVSEPAKLQRRELGLLVVKMGPEYFNKWGKLPESAEYLKHFLGYGTNLALDCRGFEFAKAPIALTTFREMATMANKPETDVEFGLIDRQGCFDSLSGADDLPIHYKPDNTSGVPATLTGAFYQKSKVPYTVTLDESNQHVRVDLGDRLTLTTADELADMLVKFNRESSGINGYVIQVCGLENMQVDRRSVWKLRLAKAMGAETNVELIKAKNNIPCSQATQLIFQYAA